MIKSKFDAVVVGIFLALIAFPVRSCTSESGFTSPGFAGTVNKYQYGGITYLLFSPSSYGGVAVVNYTKDSIEFEQYKKQKP